MWENSTNCNFPLRRKRNCNIFIYRVTSIFDSIDYNFFFLNWNWINLRSHWFQLGGVREIKSRDGVDLKVLEIVVMDETSSDFSIQIWDQDTIQRAQTWNPRETGKQFTLIKRFSFVKWIVFSYKFQAKTYISDILIFFEIILKVNGMLIPQWF